MPAYRARSKWGSSPEWLPSDGFGILIRPPEAIPYLSSPYVSIYTIHKTERAQEAQEEAKPSPIYWKVGLTDKLPRTLD